MQFKLSHRGGFEGVAGGLGEFVGAGQGIAEALDFEFAGGDLSNGLAGFAASGQCAGVAGDHAPEGRNGAFLGLGVMTAKADQTAGAVLACGQPRRCGCPCRAGCSWP
ncbi:MAG: hypothetical protein JWR32_6351 [Mycobacterium sp.]|nr:hypothetical protein [Mycobacterium sp.]